MSIHLEPGAAWLIWTGLSLAVGAFAVWLALSWAETAQGTGRRARLLRRFGVGISLGTGLWSAHGIGAAVESIAAPAGILPGIELMLWLLCVTMGFGIAGAGRTATPTPLQRVAAGCALGTAVVAIQVLSLCVADQVHGLANWHGMMLIVDWLACSASCAAAFGLCHALRSRGQFARSLTRGAAGALIAGAAVLSQYLVMRAADVTALHSADPVGLDPGTLWATIALLLSVGVLTLSRQVLVRRLRAEAERVAARHERGTQLPTDPLTGLPTRQLFEGALAQAVGQADAEQQRLALLLINLDGFKPVNQSFGHLGGDHVLREVAARLRALALPHMAARVGGDEFVMLLNGDPQPRDASNLCATVIAAISQPYRVEGREATLSCSIGVAMYPEHGARSTLIAHAHAAMGAAKSTGGASHAFFEPRLLKGARDDVELLRDLRLALENKELELYYQPKIHAPTGEITGAEALLRWNHPQRGMVSPVLFIPLAERYGLIGAIGRWVIDEACRQAHAWRDEGLRMRVAINLSVHQLRQPDLAEWIRSALQRHQIKPELLTCEVTESSAMDDTEVTMRVLGELDRVGVHISIDDFGTGHSSLSYLRKLPADELKIDRSFVMDLETSEDARKIAVAVINLAKALNLKVVAEGVETEGQNRILREFGCDQLQGYLFARPMSAKSLALWAMDDVGPRTMSFRDSLFRHTVAAMQV